MRQSSAGGPVPFLCPNTVQNGTNRHNESSAVSLILLGLVGSGRTL